MARQLHRGVEVGAVEARVALPGDAQGHHVQALKTSCRYLAAANACFVGEITAGALREQLDIGKRGRDGKPV
jgi:hypothetical protein